MNIKKHIPNIVTCGNLLSGCFSILFIASGMPVKAALMILLAGIFDFLDGFLARLLDAHSPIGPDLDSLTDIVSFGLGLLSTVSTCCPAWRSCCLCLPPSVWHVSTSTGRSKQLSVASPRRPWLFLSPRCLWHLVRQVTSLTALWASGLVLASRCFYRS